MADIDDGGFCLKVRLDEDMGVKENLESMLMFAIGLDRYFRDNPLLYRI